jgi:hypothetical protein
VWVAPEGWYEIDKYTADCFLVMKNEGEKACTVLIYTTPQSGEHKVILPGRNDPKSRVAFNLAGMGAPRGGFATTIKSDGTDVVAGISILATKK